MSDNKEPTCQNGGVQHEDKKPVSCVDKVVYAPLAVDELKDAESVGEQDEASVKVQAARRRWKQLMIKQSVEGTKQFLEDFCNNASVQGLKQIAEPQPYYARRVIWFLLLMTCFGVFVYQFVLSLQYYLQYPVSVQINISYNNTMHFPAATVCNQNAFRLTATVKNGWWPIVKDLYNHDVTNSSSSTAHRQLLRNLTFTDLHMATGHDFTDFIVDCEWNGRPCVVSDNVKKLTDYGVCYTFNSDHLNVKKLNRPGVEGGLRLRLNIEQYEYMSGPNEDAGIRVLVHDQNSFPRVRDFGQAVPPGAHALMVVGTSQVRNLPPPHGNCDPEVEHGTYNSSYSVSNCQKMCISKYVHKICGCVDGHMGSETMPVCKLDKFKCLQNATEQFHEDVSRVCRCDPACEDIEYVSRISYAEMSRFDVQHLCHSPLVPRLQEQLIDALETRHKVTDTIIESDLNMVNRFSFALSNVDTFLTDFQNKINNTKKIIDRMLMELDRRMWFHANISLHGVRYSVERNFIRAWEVMEERSLGDVTPNYKLLAENYKNALKQIKMLPDSQNQSRYSVYFVMSNELTGRLKMANEAQVNFTQVHEILTTGEPTWMYKYTYKRRYDRTFLPYSLLNNNNKQHMHFERFYNATVLVISYLSQMKDMAEDVYKLRNVSDSTIEKCAADFQSICRKYNYRLYMYKENVVNRPKVLIDAKTEQFEQQQNAYQDKRKRFADNFNSMTHVIENTESNLDVFKVILNQSIEYMSDMSALKLPLAQYVTSRDVNKKYRRIQQDLAELQTSTHTVLSDWLDLSRVLVTIWKNMLYEATTKAFYDKLYEDIQNYTHVPFQFDLEKGFADLLKMKSRLTEFRRYKTSEYKYLFNLDFSGANPAQMVSEKQTEFQAIGQTFHPTPDHLFWEKELYNAFLSLRRRLENFVQQTKINDAFFLSNFMKIDIYMNELSYTTMEHEPSYTLTQLLSDIGGSLGLFAGASVFTILEIIDFIVYQRIILRRKTR